MRTRLTYVERRPSKDAVSIERVFRQVVRGLPAEEFEVLFQTTPFGNGIAAIIRNLLFFRPHESDVYHITGDVHYLAMRLPAERTVLTIHDLIFLHRRTGLRRAVLKKLFLDMLVRRTAVLTTVSQATKDEIVKETGIDPSRVTVIENPMLDGFEPGRPKTFNADCPVILHIGTAANKNLVNLVKAVVDIECKLRIVGQLDADIHRRLRQSGIKFENVHGLDQNAIVEEYRNCDMVAFCSTYEGFGLPILEAQMMRKPVVTSNIAPMNVVAGDGAVLVDPNNIESIADGLRRVINDAEYRDQLVAAGTENVERFSGNTASDKYAEIYRRLAEKQ
jgi:glycosyltransferase involved in cell wall biosynthesis